MSEEIVASALRLYAARTERKRARSALVEYRRERGGCEINEGGACFQYQHTGPEGEKALPISEWCETCRDSQVLWLAYRKACSTQQGALRGLMSRCQRAASAPSDKPKAVKEV